MTGATTHSSVETGSLPGLFGRLFRSGVLVGSIGLAGMLVLLVLNLGQARATITLSQRYAPSAQAANDLLLGLLESQTNLQAWLLSSDEQFKSQWHRSWSETITPAQKNLSLGKGGPVSGQQIDALQQTLVDLWEAQWWARELSENPGRAAPGWLPQHRLQTLADSLDRHLGSALELSRRNTSESGLARHAVLMEVTAATERTWLNLHHYLEGTQRIPLPAILAAARRTNVLLRQINVDADPRPGSLDFVLLHAQRDWQSTMVLLESLDGPLTGAQGDHPLQRLEARSTRLTEQASRIAREVMADVETHLQYSSAIAKRDARNNSLIALSAVLLMGMAVLWLSHRTGRRFGQPIEALSDAATGLGRGTWDQELPVPDTRELAELSEAFANMRKDLHQTMDELENKSDEMEMFAYAVSHDLKAPLRAIDGFSQALAEDFDDQLPDKAHMYLDMIRNGAGDMGRLIDDILWLSRSTRGEMRQEQVDLSAMAAEILKELARQDPDRTVETEISPEIVVQGDERLLKIMLQNLLGNAWKYTRNSPDARIELDGKRMGDKVRCRLRDNGCGFDMNYADKLFKPFHRLHPSTEYEGSGIGLTSVERIVKRHHGQVWAESQPGEGSTFFVELTGPQASHERP